MLPFATLARTSSLERAAVIYRNVYIVLCSPNITPAVTASMSVVEQEIGLIADADTDGRAIKQVDIDENCDDSSKCC